MLFDALTFNIFLDCVERGTANGDNEVRRRPEMAAPKTILQGWKFLKESARCYAFEAINQLGDLLVRLDSYNHVYMVYFVLSGEQFDGLFLAKFFEQFGQSIAYLSCDNRAAILNTPNNVYLKLMYRMAAFLKVVFHTKIYDNQCLKLRKSPVKAAFSRGVTVVLIAGINPAQGHQIPPPPKGGLLW